MDDDFERMNDDFDMLRQQYMRWRKRILREFNENKKKAEKAEKHLQNKISRFETLVLKYKEEGKKAAIYYEKKIEEWFNKRDIYEKRIHQEEQKTNPYRYNIDCLNNLIDKSNEAINKYSEKILKTQSYPYTESFTKKQQLKNLKIDIEFWRQQIKLHKKEISYAWNWRRDQGA